MQGAPAPDLKDFDGRSMDSFCSIILTAWILLLVTVHCSKATPFTPLGFSKPDLYRVPIVVTVDESAIWDSTEPWLSQNLAEILLAGPCYCQLRKQSIRPDTSGPPAPKNHSRDMGLTAIVDTAFSSPPMTPSSFGK